MKWDVSVAFFRTKTVSSWIPDLLALPPWEVKLTFSICQQWLTSGFQSSDISCGFERERRIGTPCPPLPRQSKMLISSGGRVRSHHRVVVASSPHGQRPPSSHSRVKQERDVSYSLQLTMQRATQTEICVFQPFTCLNLGLLMLRTIREKKSLRS